MGSVLTIQGQTVKIPLQSNGKFIMFLVLYLLFHLSLHNIWHAHPHKNYIFKINKDRSLITPSLEFQSWKLWTQEAFEIGSFFTTFLQEMAEKNLVLEWLSWLPWKRDFISSTILET